MLSSIQAVAPLRFPLHLIQLSSLPFYSSSSRRPAKSSIAVLPDFDSIPFVGSIPLRLLIVERSGRPVQLLSLVGLGVKFANC